MDENVKKLIEGTKIKRNYLIDYIGKDNLNNIVVVFVYLLFALFIAGVLIVLDLIGITDRFGVGTSLIVFWFILAVDEGILEILNSIKESIIGCFEREEKMKKREVYY